MSTLWGKFEQELKKIWISLEEEIVGMKLMRPRFSILEQIVEE